MLDRHGRLGLLPRSAGQLQPALGDIVAREAARTPGCSEFCKGKLGTDEQFSCCGYWNGTAAGQFTTFEGFCSDTIAAASAPGCQPSSESSSVRARAGRASSERTERGGGEPSLRLEIQLTMT